MDQSHHHAETNKSVLNKYLTLDQGNRYVSLISFDNLNRNLNAADSIPLPYFWFFTLAPFISNLQGASSLHLD